jgi:2-dehydropantoate 2-reductase
LFCVKSYDSETCAQQIAPLVGGKTLILSLQNGVDNGDTLARHWGTKPVLAGVVYIGAQVVSPGVILHSSGGRIVFGPLSNDSKPARLIEDTFRSAQIPCELTPEIRRALWKKLLWNASFCAISCLTRTTVKEIVEAPSLRELAAECMNEVRQAARMHGIGLEPQLIEETIAFSESLGDFKPSMLQDLEGNKPLEFEAFNGVVVRTLAGSGQVAPINRVFYDALKFLDTRIRANV